MPRHSEYDDTQHYDTQHNGKVLLCSVSFMRGVVYSECHKKPFMTSVFKLNVIMLGVLNPIIIIPVCLTVFYFNCELEFVLFNFVQPKWTF